MSAKPPHHRPEHSILTPRLELRSARPGEGGAVFQLLSLDDNFPFGGAEPGTSPAEFEDRIRSWAQSTAEGKNGFMVIALREADLATNTPAGSLIGFGGFNSLPMEPMIESPGGNEPGVLGDIGIIIDHKFWRRGFAREATAATIEYGFRELQVGAIWVASAPTNEPLCKLMKSLGLEPFRRLDPRRDGGGRSRNFVDLENKENKENIWEFGPESWNRAKKSTGILTL